MIAFTLTLSLLASTQSPDAVVVFPDRAQVTRTTTIACGARVPVSFTNVPPGAAVSSFRAIAVPGNIDALRADLKTRESEYSPKVQALEKKLRDLQRELALTRDASTRATGQTSWANQYQSVATQLVGREMSADRPDVKAWATAWDTVLTSRLAGARGQVTAGEQAATVREKIAAAQIELSALQGQAGRASYQVDVLVSCPAGRSSQVSLNYVVGGASWVPAYEAHAFQKEGRVDLSTFATVKQVSGEDWAAVKLVLSTAVPSQNATPPDLNRLEVRASEAEEAKKVLVRRDEYVASAKVGSSGGAETGSNLRAVDRGLSVQLEVQDKATVTGEGTAVRLLVGKTPLRAKFVLTAMPAMVPAVFKTAELTNHAAWPLLAGQVESYVVSGQGDQAVNGLVGRYPLERVAQGAAFTLTFGIDENVRVKRTVVEELKRDASLFNNKRRFSFAYRYEVSNYGSSVTEVSLADRMPVSEVDDVTVTLGEKVTPGYSIGATDGVVTWPLKLSPQERKSVDLAFRIDVPTSYDSGAL